VRKHGGDLYILPGGKREPSDRDDRDTLRREIDEELRCSLDEASIEWAGTFHDQSADDEDERIAVHLFAGDLVGEPRPSAEIEELRWFDPRADDPRCLAPSIRNAILPHFLGEGGTR
jgi:8-oxo-dGTP pyrophosphatase MutT (NUDIX family)